MATEEIEDVEGLPMEGETDVPEEEVKEAAPEEAAKETKEELFSLRFQLRTGHLSDVRRLRVLRRAYAQIQTLLGEKQAAEKKYV